MIIQTHNLSKKYKQTLALDQVSLAIPRGCIYGLIGENGAGKTTLMKLITGQIHPTNGSFEVFGGSPKQAQQRIGSLIETPGIYANLSAKDNLTYKSKCLGLNDSSVIDRILDDVGLAKVGTKPAGHFSMGMKQRLGVALALLGNPDLLILDEPVNGMDPQGIVEFRQLFQRLNREHGMTIVLSSHLLDELARCANSFGVLKQGQLIDEFTREELDNRTQDQLVIVSQDIGSVAALLEQKLAMKDYQIVGQDTLEIKQATHLRQQIARLLYESNIFVEQIEVRKASLEDYFLKLSGGQHA